MAKPKGLTVTLDEVSQSIDLNEVAGADLSDSPDLVDKIGQAIIDFTEQRAQSGKGIGGRSLPAPYSPEYAASLPFKAAGKSKREINMTLSGDMLGAMDIQEADGATIKIGFQGEIENVKAFAHITGFQGHPTITGAKKREFFGVTKDELREIVSKFSTEIADIRNAQPQESTRRQAAAAVRSAADLFDFTEDEDA